MAITHSVKFSASAKEAISEIQEYEDRIVATAQTVDKYANSLGGGKIISQAHNWVAAVERVGGVTNLTEVQQRKLNSALGAAIDQYDALKQQAPTAMRAMYEETKRSEGGISSLVGKLGPLGPAVVGAFSVHAITSFVSSAVKAGTEAHNLARRLNDSAENVQRLQYVAAQTGAPFEGMTESAGRLRAMIGSGNDGALGALKELGLNAKEIGESGAYESLASIGEAIAKISDPARQSALAVKLFGEQGAKLLPAITADMRAIGEQAPVMSNATAAAMKTAGDRWDWLTGKVKVAGAEMLNFSFNAAIAFSRIDYWGKATPPVIKHEAAVRAAAAAMLDASGRALNVAVSLDEADKIAKELTATVSAKATPSFAKLVEQEVAAWKGSENIIPSFRVLNGQLVQVAKNADNGTDALKKFTGWAVDPLNSSSMNLGTVALPAVQDGLRGAANEARDAMGPIGSFFDAIKTGSSGLVDGLTGGNGLSGFFENIGKGITDQLGAIVTNGMSALIAKGIDLAWDGVKKIGSVLKGLFSDGEYGDVKDLRKAFENGLGGVDNLIKLVSDAYANMGKTGTEAEKALKDFWEAKTLDDYYAALKVIQDAIGDTTEKLIELSRVKVGNPYKYLDPYTSDPIPGFASGVSNFGGGWAMVGERGPELVHLPSGSDVYPNGTAPGQASTITIPVAVSGEQFARVVIKHYGRVLSVMGA